jgi:hypothetical protein
MQRILDMSGRLTDILRTDVKVQRFARARYPWFYLHAHRLVRNGSDLVTVVIPIIAVTIEAVFRSVLKKDLSSPGSLELAGNPKNR